MAEASFEWRVATFWSKVDRSAGPSACWIWKGAVTSKWHYGCFAAGDGRVLGAHRIAWLLTNGDPAELCVLHRCDNRVCVNPAHLFLGTKKENTADAMAKDRHARGERTKRNRLTETQARYIKENYRKTSPRRGNGTELANRFGVNVAVVHACARGRSWKHVK